jgi:hypothetical protein
LQNAVHGGENGSWVIAGNIRKPDFPPVENHMRSIGTKPHATALRYPQLQPPAYFDDCFLPCYAGDRMVAVCAGLALPMAVVDTTKNMARKR